MRRLFTTTREMLLGRLGLDPRRFVLLDCRVEHDYGVVQIKVEDIHQHAPQEENSKIEPEPLP